MEGMDDAQMKAALAARGAKHLTEAVSCAREQKAIRKNPESFAKEVKKTYKLFAAGRFEATPLSFEEILKKEFPDGQFGKPYGSVF
mmetsp:Transcript_69240/g.196202  ORF Transcript_69240/g.196202 Transcript_69240/m.196202 type:complete len:86 (+) Transcript_69240:104-361(+)